MKAAWLEGERRVRFSRARASSFAGRFENVLDVRVAAQAPDEDITRVETPGGSRSPSRIVRTRSVHARSSVFSPRRLARKRPEGLSARNILAGTVESIDDSGGVAMVRVATPKPVYVKLTHRAVAQLDLKAENAVHLIVKTHSIHRLG